MNEYEIVKNHLRDNHKFESVIDRDKDRRDSTHEFFTPYELVDKGVSLFDDSAWAIGKTFIDSSCGDGQLLSGVILKKIEKGCTYTQAIDDIYGIEYEQDNCILCINRLFGAYELPKIKIFTGNDIPHNWRSIGLKSVFEVNGNICNIVCADALTYDYSFGTNENVPELFDSLFE